MAQPAPSAISSARLAIAPPDRGTLDMAPAA
jgi:hypothetical protein